MEPEPSLQSEAPELNFESELIPARNKVHEIAKKCAKQNRLYARTASESSLSSSTVRALSLPVRQQHHAGERRAGASVQLHPRMHPARARRE